MSKRSYIKGGIGALLAIMLFALCITLAPRTARAVEGSLLEGKQVTASAAYETMPASNLVDGNDATRWSTEANAPQWAYVDMGSEQTVSAVEYLPRTTGSASDGIGEYRIFVY